MTPAWCSKSFTAANDADLIGEGVTTCTECGRVLVVDEDGRLPRHRLPGRGA